MAASPDDSAPLESEPGDADNLVAGEGEAESTPSTDSPSFAEQSAQLMESLQGFEQKFRDERPVIWWSALLGPPLGSLLILAVIGAAWGWEILRNLVIAVVATFFVFGRFVILMGGGEPIEIWNVTFQMSAESLLVMLTYMDFATAVFVAVHMGVMFKLPLVGGKLAGLVSDGQFILRQQPWIRRAAFIGLVLFVIFPSSTTGSIGGSIFGRLLGMQRWRVITAIFIGSLCGNGLMYLLSSVLPKHIRDNFVLKLVGVLIMVVVLFFAERYFRAVKKKLTAQEA